MRKSKTLKFRVFILSVLAFLALGSLGHSYAYLISHLKISSKFNTGDFNNVFAGDRIFSADIVNMASDDKEIVKSVNIETQIGNGGKSVEVVFKEGIPTELFDENNYLRISYPLDEKGTTLLLPYELDLSKSAEKVTMNVKKAFISITGTVFEYNYADTVFNKPLVFDAYRSIDIVDNKPVGNLYLKSVASNKIELPQEIKLTQEEVSNLVPAPEELYEQDGIQVSYFCEIDLHIDQAAAGEVIEKK
jgi:hypothetical protein